MNQYELYKIMFEDDDSIGYSLTVNIPGYVFKELLRTDLRTLPLDVQDEILQCLGKVIVEAVDDL